jgi:hypothetical protein
LRIGGAKALQPQDRSHSFSATVQVSAAAQEAALGAMSAIQAFGFLVGPLLASYLYSIQHSMLLMADASILLLAQRWRCRYHAGSRLTTDARL